MTEPSGDRITAPMYKNIQIDLELIEKMYFNCSGLFGFFCKLIYIVQFVVAIIANILL